MGECVLTRRSVVKNEYQKLADIVVSGSAVTQIDISGLNIGKDEEIVLVSDVVGGATGGAILLFVNNNYTSSNYYGQRLYAQSSTIGAYRLNYGLFLDADANKKNMSIASIKIANSGHFVVQSQSMVSYVDNASYLSNYATTSTFTISSITDLRIASLNANQISIGSRFQLYKVGG